MTLAGNRGVVSALVSLVILWVVCSYLAHDTPDTASAQTKAMIESNRVLKNEIYYAYN